MVEFQKETPSTIPFNPFDHFIGMAQLHARMDQSKTAEKEEGRLSSLFRSKRLHKGWNPIELSVDDHTYTAFEIPAENPKGIMAFMTGCESSPLLFAKEVKKWREEGFHIIGVPQVNRRQHPDNVERNIALTRHVLLDDDSPLQKLKRETGLPVYIKAHSAGILLSDVVIHESPENLKKAIQTFDHIAPLGGFYGAVGVTPRYEGQQAPLTQRFKAWAATKIMNAYSSTWPDRELYDAPVDKWVMRTKGIMRDLSSMDCASLQEKFDVVKEGLTAQIGSIKKTFMPNPTHGEARDMRRLAHEHVLKMERLAADKDIAPLLRAIPRTYILGERDEASCNETNRYMATLTGGTVHVVDSDHDVIRGNAETMEILKNAFKPKAPVSFIPQPVNDDLTFGARAYDLHLQTA